MRKLLKILGAKLIPGRGEPGGAHGEGGCGRKGRRDLSRKRTPEIRTSLTTGSENRTVEVEAWSSND